MNKNILWLIALCFVASLSFVSCEETDGAVDSYYNWEERNRLYLDSIAQVARDNQGDEVGQWKIVRSYKLPPLDWNEGDDVEDCIYCKIVEKGTGASPLFKDSVDVHYKGELIPLYNGETVTFDASYTGELDLETDITVGFMANEVIVGWTTALQEMKEGSRWMLYIPSELAYGEYGQSSIPANSTLVFDVYLQKVIPLKDIPIKPDTDDSSDDYYYGY